MADFQLQAYLDNHKRKIETRLRGLIDELQSGSPKLREAIAYSLFAGGKRLRPILLIAGHEIFSPLSIYALDAACAIEMLHTYSLIHDDLPSFDDDDLRRGRPSSHRVFGEWMAILAGDALNTLAFGVLAGGSDDVPPEWKLEAVRVVATAAGAPGMAGGQALDMSRQGVGDSEENILTLQRLKTGALIAAATETGALLAGATKEQRNQLRLFGIALGQAFQIRDDLLDIEGSSEQVGKSTGKDADAGKATLPALIGSEQAAKRADRFATEAVKALDIFGEKAEPLRAIADYVVARRI